MQTGIRWPLIFRYAPLLLTLIGFLFAVFCLPAALRQRVPAKAPAATSPASPPEDSAARAVEFRKQLDTISASRDSLKSQLDSIARDAATAQWLLAMILGVAGLFTVAQSIFAYFSAQSYVKQAEDAISRAKEAVAKADAAVTQATSDARAAVARIDALAIEVRNKYPIFNDVESARADAFNQLSRLNPALDEDQNLYAKSDPLMRQRILAIESFAALQFLSPSSHGPELLRNLRLLGKFYAGKFTTERLGNPDFERAQYYFDLALERFGRPFPVLNDLGWLWAVVATPPDFERARSCFEESLRRQPGQQRASFNLGTLAFDRANPARLETALNLLLQAARQANWEDRPNPPMASHISYNLACVCDALSAHAVAPDESTRRLDQCAEYLEAAAKVGFQQRSVVEADLKEDGDLRNLARSAAHAPRLQAALALYASAWQQPH